MKPTVKWTIGTGIALAALVVGIAMLLQNSVLEWQDAQEQLANERHRILTSQMSDLENDIEALQGTVDEGQRTARIALAIAARNHQNDPIVEATGSQSEIVEILDYLDDVPRNVGRTLEEGADDVLEEFENAIEALGDLFE